jgi:hypothetical protein
MSLSFFIGCRSISVTATSTSPSEHYREDVTWSWHGEKQAMVDVLQYDLLSQLTRFWMEIGNGRI